MSARKHSGNVSATITILRLDHEGEEHEIDVEVQGYYTPEQNGGMTDPSWSADIDFETAVTATGDKITLTDNEVDSALDALWEVVRG